MATDLSSIHYQLKEGENSAIHREIQYTNDLVRLHQVALEEGAVETASTARVFLRESRNSLREYLTNIDPTNSDIQRNLRNIDKLFEENK